MRKVHASSVLFLGFSSLIFAVSVANAQTEWEKIVAAAKREGKVAVIGPQGTETRQGLTEAFEKKYPGIRVEVAGMAGNQVAPRLLNELRAGRNTTDVVVTGTTTAIESLLPADAIVPIPPFLVGPNTRDQSVRRGGKFEYSDNAGQYNMIMTAYVKAPFVYNPNLVNPAEFKSWKDLLNPKWKGKIVLRDPTGAGGGLGNATFWYTHKDLGKEFIRALLTQQNVTLGRDDRQILDFVGQGKFALAIGPSDVLTNELIGRGLPLKHMSAEPMREGTYMTAGNGSFVVVKDAANPNAAKVYIDFLLSKEGQTEWSKSAGFASLRRDVPRDHVLELLVPKDGVDYPPVSSERYVKLRSEVVGYVKSVLGR